MNKKLFTGWSAAEWISALLALGCFVYALHIAVCYSGQPLLDPSSFRQAQTALTAYWLVQNGLSLAYETPVGGPPWSVPFEFPIYQYIVAFVVETFGFGLDATGRLVSFVFLVLCTIPVWAVCKRLNLSRFTFFIFCALLFSSPMYLYWGRTFMIETTALFLALCCVPFFIDIINKDHPLKAILLFVLFISAAILQKATTGLPVLAVLGMVYLIFYIKRNSSLRRFFSVKNILLGLICFGIPLAVGTLWVDYTDHIRALNPFGAHLTSTILRPWNWGTLPQRFSSALYETVIWERIFEQNLVGYLGVALLVLPFFSKANKKIKGIIAASILLGFLPVFLFTNLYIVHDYYQSASVIFFLFALSVVLGEVLNKYISNLGAVVLLIVLMVFNYISFNKDFRKYLTDLYQEHNKHYLPVANMLKENMPEDTVFVAFGDDWSSFFAYYSERKSFTIPTFFNEYNKVASNPENYVGDHTLGAVVLCPAQGMLPTKEQLFKWAKTDKKWNVTEVERCYVALPAEKN